MSQLDKIYMGWRDKKYQTQPATKLGIQIVVIIFLMIFLDLIQFPMKVLFMGFSTDFGRGL